MQFDERDRISPPQRVATVHSAVAQRLLSVRNAYAHVGFSYVTVAIDNC
ncbi:hypothetical protein I546_1202 [Mycobacterium kansasii 732]|nr:hypothetical protein I546_1202 [Mycobacterium kansasii 732]